METIGKAVPAFENGVRVPEFTVGSVAQKAGFQPNDIILKVSRLLGGLMQARCRLCCGGAVCAAAWCKKHCRPGPCGLVLLLHRPSCCTTCTCCSTAESARVTQLAASHGGSSASVACHTWLSSMSCSPDTALLQCMLACWRAGVLTCCCPAPLQVGDYVVEAAPSQVTSVVTNIKAAANKEIPFTVLRGEEQLVINCTPEVGRGERLVACL